MNKTYKHREDIAIVNYILNNKGHHKLGGRAFWIEMESKLNINRSWQSMKERFRSVIVKELDNRLKYQITPSDAAILRKMIAVKFRTANNFLDNRYKEKMKESQCYSLPNKEKKPEKEESPRKDLENKNNLNDNTSRNNIHTNKWLNNLLTWIETYPQATRIEIPTVPETPICSPKNAILNNDQNTSTVKNNVYRCKKTLEEIQQQQVVEISSEEDDKSTIYSHQNISCNISTNSQENIILKQDNIKETVETQVVPGSSCNNTSFVCESHQSLPKCFYCFINNYNEHNENTRSLFSNLRKFHNHQSSNKANKRSSNEENVQPKKKLKNNNRCPCAKNNDAVYQEVMEHIDASSSDSNVSNLRVSHSTPKRQSFEFICLQCKETNVFINVVSEEAKRSFKKNCNHCRSLHKISYSNKQLIGIRLMPDKDSQSIFSSDDKQKAKTDVQNKKHLPKLPQSPLIIDLTQLSDNIPNNKNVPCKIDVPSHTLKQIHPNDICAPTPVILTKTKTKTATDQSTQYQFIKERSIPRSTDYTSIHTQKETPLKENVCAPVILKTKTKATTDRSTQYQFINEKSTDNSSSCTQKEIIVKENVWASVSKEQPKIKSTTDRSTQCQFTKERSIPRSTDNLPSHTEKEIIVKENIWASVSKEQPEITAVTNQSMQCLQEKSILKSTVIRPSHTQKQIFPSKKTSAPFIEIHTKLKPGKPTVDPNDKIILSDENMSVKQTKIKAAEPKKLITTEDVPILLSPISKKPLKAKEDLQLETNSVKAYSEKTTSSRRRRKLFTQIEPDIEEYNENEHDQNTDQPIVIDSDHQYEDTFSELMEEVKKIIMTETCQEISEKTKILNSSTKSELSLKKSSSENKPKDVVLKNVQIILNKNEVEDYTRKVTFMENLSLSMSSKKMTPSKKENGGIPHSKRSQKNRDTKQGIFK